LFGAKIEAKARAKPKEGLETCSSLFRPFLAKRISVEMAKKNGNNRVHFHGTHFILHFILHFNEGNLVPLSTIIIATTSATKINLSVLLVAKNGA
jgi:hypothetical protein